MSIEGKSGNFNITIIFEVILICKRRSGAMSYTDCFVDFNKFYGNNYGTKAIKKQRSFSDQKMLKD